MTASLYQITFTPTGGVPIRLLDYGDFLETPLAFGVRQPAQSITPLGSPWGGTHAGGGTRRTLTWQCQKEHASHTDADSYIQRLAATLPFLTTGLLQVAVNGGEVWDLQDATILDSSARRYTDGNFATLENLQLDCGHTLPVSGFGWYPTIPTEWDLSAHSDKLAFLHNGTLPNWRDLMPDLVPRVVNDGGEKWFEFGFVSDSLLSGSVGLLWYGADGAVSIRAQRTENITTWAGGDFTDCVGSPSINSDGHYEYWVRSKYPVDSAVKSGVITCSASPSPDTRNNGLTSIVVKNIVLALGYPFTFPGDASRLQTELQPYYPGATVTATTYANWVITLPGINLTSYAEQSRVYWPAYTVTEAMTGATTTVDGCSFIGTWVNAAGVRTAVPKQFARLFFDRVPIPSSR
ncbi:MAG: hypothetical protein WCP45_04745 [Verrucomicrobiota bacterium]